MKTFQYKLDEEKILRSELLKGNPEQKDLIDNIIKIDNESGFNKVIANIIITDKGICINCLDILNQNKYNYITELPVLIRNVVYKILHKLQIKYCY